QHSRSPVLYQEQGTGSALNVECSVLNISKFLPATPDSAITLPTTRYKSAKPLSASLRAADREELKPQPEQLPLVWLLVLSQLSVGLLTFALLFGLVPATNVTNSTRAVQSLAALVVGTAALIASIGHLGRPLGAWRSFL